MKQIYFKKADSESNPSWSQKLLRSSSLLAAQSAPALTSHLAEKILCTPQRGKNLLQNKKLSTEVFYIHGHRVMTYWSAPAAKTILLSHGWSGDAGNFATLIERLLQLNYQVVTLDHVAHGRSGGRYANFFLFIESLKTVIQAIEKQGQLAAVIGHSMGASAAMTALARHPQSLPCVYLAPVLPFFETLYESVDRFGLATEWIDLLLHKFEKRYQMKIDDLIPHQYLKNTQHNMLLIHDAKDSYIPLEKNLELLPTEMHSLVYRTEGLGHFRILKSEQVHDKILEFMRSCSSPSCLTERK